MPEEFGAPSKWAIHKKVGQWAWKGFIWIRTRRSAQAVGRAITNNQVAVAALAASVAAGSIGALATYSAHEAQSDANRALQKAADLEVAVAVLSADVRAQDVDLGKLESAVRRYRTATDAQIKAMGKDAQSLAQSLAVLVDRVASLPAAPSLAPLAGQVSRLAEDVLDATKKAELAARNAERDRPDQEARAAAAGAKVDAGLAAAKALEALKVAQQAEADALAAAEVARAAKATGEAAEAAALAAGKSAEAAAAIGAQAQRDALEALNKPGYQPFPRVIELPNYTDPPGAGGQTKTFVVDLPRGTYKVTLEAEGSGVQAWYVDLSSGTTKAPRFNSIGASHIKTEMTFVTGGGTSTFSVVRDGFNPNSPAVFTDTTVTFEEIQP